MPVSQETFEKLQAATPYKSEDDLKSEGEQQTSDDLKLRNDQQTGFVKASIEHIKKGAAGTAELANAGVRLFMAAVNPSLMFRENDDQIPAPFRPGAATKAIVDQRAIDQEGPMAKAFGGAMEGVGSIATMPVPPAAKAAGEVAATGVKAAAAWATKQGVLGMGMGEGSEIGKYIFGGLGDWFGGDKGKDIGEWLGSVVGGAAGGQANVIRVNATAEAAKAAATNVKSTVGSVAPAMRDTFAAKRSGDTRAAFSIFMDHYSDLRSKGMGLLQASTNEKIAAIIGRDPQHQQELKAFDDAIRETDVDAGLFSTGQKAGNPTLTQTEIQQKRTKEEAAAADAKKKGQQNAITTAYKTITDRPLPLGTKAFDESMNLYRMGTIAKADTLVSEANAIQKSVPNWSDTQAAESGAKLREQYDKELSVRKQEDAKNYQQVYEAADAQGFRVDLAPVAKETKEVLKPLLAQIDSPTVPNSIRSLNKLLTKESRAAEAKKAASEDVPFYMKGRTEPLQVKGHSMKEVDDVIKQLGADAHEAFSLKTAEGNTVGRNLNKIGESLLKQVETQAPPDVASAYINARSEYANKTVPRFKEGANLNLDRDATAANKGREKVTDQNVWNSYLRKSDLVDRMEQFDTLFGGNHGAPKNKEAYKMLGDAIGDKYSKEVLQGGFTRDKHEKFMREYNSAFEQVPEARKAAETRADQLDLINQKKDILLDQYANVVGSPLTEKIGPVQAQQLLLQSLADPVKMEKLLNSPLGATPEAAKSVLKEATTFANPMKEGKYDPDKLVKLLTMGEHRPGEPTSMQMLFNKAMGPEEGAKHTTRLTAIAELMRREAMTDSSYMRFQPQGDKGPVQGGTGQTMASWIGQFYAVESGRIGKPYALVTAGGRFLNNSMQKAATQAMERALYDPAMSSAILELVQTPSNQAVSREAWSKVFGAADGASKVLKNLTDHGLIRAQMARGALYGVQQENEEDRDSSKPRRELRLPQ